MNQKDKNMKDTNMKDASIKDSSIKEENLTPVMSQYISIKKEYNDYLLFFRMGDFYELFFEDATLVSSELNLVLTQRDKSRGGVPMCGMPFHASSNYISRLIKLGYKIAICEQIDKPSKMQKGPLKREVVRVITPGTVTEDEFLECDSNNFLICIYADKKRFKQAVVNVLSTNGMNVNELSQGLGKRLSVDFDSVSVLRKENEWGSINDKNYDQSHTRNSLNNNHNNNLSNRFSDSLNDNSNHNNKNNDRSIFFVSYIDISTKEFFLQKLELQELISALEKINPREIVLPDYLYNEDGFCNLMNEWNLNWRKYSKYFPESIFDHANGKKLLHRFYNVKTLDFVDTLSNEQISCMGGLFEYINITQLGIKTQIALPKVIQNSDFLRMDAFTIRNLDIFSTQSIVKNATLFSTLNDTITAMGARQLKMFLMYPLTSINAINNRLNAVEFFITHQEILKNVRESLKNTFDMKRIISRITSACLPSVFPSGLSGRESKEDFQEMSLQSKNASNIRLNGISKLNIKDVFAIKRSLKKVSQIRECFADYISSDNINSENVTSDHNSGDSNGENTENGDSNSNSSDFSTDYNSQHIQNSKEIRYSSVNSSVNKKITGQCLIDDESSYSVNEGVYSEFTKDVLPQLLEGTLLGLGDYNKFCLNILECLNDDNISVNSNVNSNVNVNSLNDGYIIKEGFFRELDSARNVKENLSAIIEQMRRNYIKLTQVNTLKIKNNNILGYFIEIPLSQQSKALHEFIKKQTTTNSVRYKTEELLKLEEKLSLASSRVAEIEEKILESIVSKIVQIEQSIKGTATSIGYLDVLTTFANLSVNFNYNRPEINDLENFIVKNGRHPVIERRQKNFVPNDCCLINDNCFGSDSSVNGGVNSGVNNPVNTGANNGANNGANDQNQIYGQDIYEDTGEINKKTWLLTGPNMAGKSTFLRQNALIVIMSQIGCFVPADSAFIGVTDKLFSRIGAADDLANDRSTFMVEAIETAAILHNATSKSFVILDELGRGTSTYDGLSVAVAVLEKLYMKNKCRTIFATHYHEISSMVKVDCYNMKIAQDNEKIHFLYKVVPGNAKGSYGINVAQIAGMPKDVIERAWSIFKFLQSDV